MKSGGEKFLEKLMGGSGGYATGHPAVAKRSYSMTVTGLHRVLFTRTRQDYTFHPKLRHYLAVFA